MTTQHASERTFEALPPVRGTAFARSWWGRTWLKALEDTALDGKQVKAGRRHARAGAVGAVSVQPGRITAVVRDRDGMSYRSDVLVQQLSAADWARLLELVAGRAGHLAALLDGEMPPELVEDAEAVGVELLPGIGDLEPECACEAWDHCAHTVALCHQVARLLDEDPFVLLLMRGRGESKLVKRVQELGAERNTAHAPRPPAGVLAHEAFTARHRLPPLPAPLPVADTPVRSPLSAGDVPAGCEVDVAALEFLAADAAVRARMLLEEALAPGHELTPLPAEPTVREDAARLTAAGPPQASIARLTAAALG
ncbi:putative Zn finger protein [Streptomyces olivoverticillatus]|uniref:Putative Zn finger protein n=1 Tax=Streptomyces olivoverticillatus TaxID=66427 RepID=A0A7W7PKI6_9ACTN|nr:putative Zn finger protein [Streptomyces olivoverticillatus]